MGRANRGAVGGGGLSIGVNIELPHEQGTNPWVRRSVFFRFFFVRKMMLARASRAPAHTPPVRRIVFFRFFFVRKMMLARYSRALIAFPGGYGTLDELFEYLTLMQTGRRSIHPLILLAARYWTPLT